MNYTFSYITLMNHVVQNIDDYEPEAHKLFIAEVRIILLTSLPVQMRDDVKRQAYVIWPFRLFSCALRAGEETVASRSGSPCFRYRHSTVVAAVIYSSYSVRRSYACTSPAASALTVSRPMSRSRSVIGRRTKVSGISVRTDQFADADPLPNSLV